MRICRFYYSGELAENTNCQLPRETANYIAKVLRLKASAAIHLFNGSNGYYLATLTEVSKQSVSAEITQFISSNNESPLHLHLGQVVGKTGKMELVIQKAVELGVNVITPLLSDFSTVKLDETRWLKKHEHWQKIIISACEQCERNVLPKLNPVMKLNDWIAQRSEQAKIILHPRANSQFQKNTKIQSAALLIGPEGGFSENELQAAQQQDFESQLLGPRVLRTETAALAAISYMQTKFGDFS